MTREEAIRQLDGADAMLMNRDFKKFNQAVIMAINALREQEQGCEYCTPVKGDYGYQFGKDFPNDGGHIAICIRWNRDGDATLHSEAFEAEEGEEILKDYFDTPIRRCPMCGRKLEVEQ